MTPLPFPVFEYIEQYLTCFNVGDVRGMHTDGNELQVLDCLGEHRDTPVAGCS